MKTFPQYLNFILFGLIISFSYAKAQQTIPIDLSIADEYILDAGDKSIVQLTPLSKIAGTQNESKWAISVRPTFSRKHTSPEAEALKVAKMAEKLASYNPTIESNPKAVNPQIGVNFEANPMIYGTPPDNDVAISNGGKIVSVNNDGIYYFSEQGQLLYNDFWSDFVNDNTLTGTLYDPKVLYDSGSDRFIVVLLHGSTSTTSKVIVCFSLSNDPSDGFYVYQLNGNPLNDGSWFDYPNIGISNAELFISGNLYYDDNSNNQSIFYQISKVDGYAGNTLSNQYWSNLSNTGVFAFSLVPTSNGHQGNIGPGIYFVSNQSQGGDRVSLWNLSNTIDNSPTLNKFNVSIGSYSLPGNSLQLNNNDELDIGDCRIKSAFYLNGYIHYVFHIDIGNGWGGIHYDRLQISNLTNQNSTFGLQGSYDYAYPSVVSYATTATDQSVMIAFLRSSQAIYPEVRVVNCDNSFQWSASTLVKDGETYVDYLSGTERWGDYIGMSRKHNSPNAKVWLAGSYGASISSSLGTNKYKTWVAEVSSTSSAQAPVADFTSNVTSGIAPLTVAYSDMSINNPTSWTWALPGATPNISNLQNPVVQYASPGTYQATLTSTNSLGSDSETKMAYITVASNPNIPVANFVGDQLSGQAPLTVNFTDLSSNSPTSWSWSFPGGTPATSTLENPSVLYSNQGNYMVELEITNIHGSDSQIRNAYIQVSPTPVGVKEVKKDFSSSVYPNPVIDIASILFTTHSKEVVTIQLIDIHGKLVKLLYKDIPKTGENKLNFNKGVLSSGIYFVLIETDKSILKNEKIIIN